MTVWRIFCLAVSFLNQDIYTSKLCQPCKYLPVDYPLTVYCWSENPPKSWYIVGSKTTDIFGVIFYINSVLYLVLHTSLLFIFALIINFYDVGCTAPAFCHINKIIPQHLGLQLQSDDCQWWNSTQLNSD